MYSKPQLKKTCRTDQLQFSFSFRRLDCQSRPVRWSWIGWSLRPQGLSKHYYNKSFIACYRSLKLSVAFILVTITVFMKILTKILFISPYFDFRLAHLQAKEGAARPLPISILMPSERLIIYGQRKSAKKPS